MVPITLADLVAAAHRVWPVGGAESWDAVGLIAGDPAAAVRRVLLAVDPVADTVAEATEGGYEALVVHHPLLLRGVHTVAEDSYKGALLARLIRAGCGLLAAHTNADVVSDGTSAVIAKSLNLTDIRPIRPGSDPAEGLGRVGSLPQVTTLALFAEHLAEIFPPTVSGIRVAGDPAVTVRNVAICAGAGDALLTDPAVREADVYITSDLRHHPASEAREHAIHVGGPALIDVSHWASESLWLEAAASALRSALPGLTVTVSAIRTDPWTFAVSAPRA